MKLLFKTLKVAGIVLAGVVLLLTVIITIFVNMSPQFGKSPDELRQKEFVSFSNYKDGKFLNQIPTAVSPGFFKTISIAKDFLFSNIPGRHPAAPLPVRNIDSTSIAERSEDIARLTWFGHSAIFLEIDGRKIFIDPMLGQVAGPISLVSPKRYNRALPIEIEALPFIDVVIISHDHYDHLDHGSIVKLKAKVGHFFVPLGVGAHLVAWGVAPEKITEMNWWEEAGSDGITLVCAPARHFSGRGFTSNTTLWSSWIIQTEHQRFFFSGDSGYGPHFKEIGERYGPFDLAMMECGQYNDLWSNIHMMPEETVKATIDVQGKLLMPIHWGAFSLAMHPWTDPITRVTAAAALHNVPVATPHIGEPVMLDYNNIPRSMWW